jgi:hypothetical protein
LLEPSGSFGDLARRRRPNGLDHDIDLDRLAS